MQTVMNTLADLGYWNWIFAAFGLAMLEMIIPGVHFLWFGVAAVLVAILTAVFGFAWQWQLFSFGILAVATVFAVTRWANGDADAGDAPNLNFRGKQYVGRSVVIETQIVDGRGKVRVGDTLWTAEGPDLPAGTTVKVTGTNGTVLVVAAVK